MPPSELGPAVADIVAARIHHFRTQGDIAYTELSRRLNEIGVPVQHVAIKDIEKGRRKVSAAELIGFAYAFDVSPIALLMPSGIDRADAVPGTGLAADTWLAWLRGDEPFGLAPGERGGRRKLEFLVRSSASWELDQYVRDIEAGIERRERGEADGASATGPRTAG
jgi:hypothetical protein